MLNYKHILNAELPKKKEEKRIVLIVGSNPTLPSSLFYSEGPKTSVIEPLSIG